MGVDGEGRGLSDWREVRPEKIVQVTKIWFQDYKVTEMYCQDLDEGMVRQKFSRKFFFSKKSREIFFTYSYFIFILYLLINNNSTLAVY
jgi:hypothetical protein